MKLIHHLFQEVTDIAIIIFWLLTVFGSFYYESLWVFALIMTAVGSIWLWMGIHFWRKENQMFDRQERIFQFKLEQMKREF